MKEYDVVALGELLVDFTMNGISGQGNPLFEANPGGAPCNVLSMLQKLGRKTAFIGRVGRDSFGIMLKAAVAEQGIDVQNLSVDEVVPTTLAFVHTAPDGDRSFSFYRNPGADMMLQKEDVDTGILQNARIFHFGTLSMTNKQIEETTVYALDIAKQSGALISFDPNLRPPLWDSLDHAREKMSYGIAQCDILKISDDEIAFFTGISDIDEGIKKIQEEYHVPFICATMGKEGSRAYYHESIVEGPPFLQEDTIETTGAGDTFMGSILHFILEYGLEQMHEKNIKYMLTFANAAASLITTKKGALRVMPTREETESLIERRIGK